MRTHIDRVALVWGAVLAIAFAAGAGCMNGALHNYKARVNESPSGRFALVIEANRTAIDGSHFLIDTATGDVWRMDSSDGRSGAWVRLGAGPADARDLGVEDEPDDA
ncbi:MAG TPA: hypothetical protein VKB65_11925 [Myxococcota bacterium]|nr:hypothetical protein [Myxococcota bacterium]